MALLMRKVSWCIVFVLCGVLVAPARADTLLPFDAPAGEALFEHADAHAGAFELLRYFETQQDLSYCGVASSVIVLNSLGVEAPVTPHLYPHRMFDQTNLFTDKVLAIKPPKMVALRGLQLEELGAILATFDLKVDVYHANQLKTAGRFRDLAAAALADPNARVVVNYSRKALGQAGGGHISPLAAYDAQSDRFLILDVARYKLPPVWVTAKDLFAAMNTKDTDSGKKRGMVIVRSD